MRYGESPVDLEDGADEDSGDLLWSTTAIVIAALVLLLTNAVSLSDWIEDMPPSAAQAHAAEVAADWRDATDQIGLAMPRSWMHDRWKRAEDAHF